VLTSVYLDPFGAKPAPDVDSKGLFGAKRGNNASGNYS